MKQLRILLASLAALFVSSGAHAAFLGDTVSCSSNGFFSAGCSPGSAVVGAGIEFDVPGSASGYHWSVDIGASSVVFTDLSPAGSFGGHGAVFLTGFDLADIIGISNFVTTASSGITASDISFTASSITIDAFNSNWLPNQFLSFDIVTAVPEPGVLALLAGGLVGIGVARRRKAA